MPTFSYKAKDKSGTTVTGIVDGASPQAAAAAVREMGYFPMDIRQTRGESVAKGVPKPPIARRVMDIFWTGVGVRALALFFRQFAVLLASGMMISEALRSVGSRSRGRMRRIIFEAVSDTEQGNPITASLARHPAVFRRLELSMIQAGESGGLLEPMVDRLASYLEFELEVRRMITKALFYPGLIVAFVILIPHVPMLVLNGFRAFAVSLWASLAIWVPWLLVSLLALKLLFQIRPIRYLWDFIKVQPPWIGTAARKVAMSRFSRAFAMLYAAGITLGDALDTAADACANLYISSRLRSARSAIERGSSLLSALESARVLSPIVADMLATGEKTGDIDSVLQKAAEYMERETDATIHKITLVIFVLALCGAAVFAAVMVLGMYMGYIGGILGR